MKAYNMKEYPSLFTYKSGTTILHRTSAKVKLPVMMALTVLLFIAGIRQLLLLSLFLTILALLARLPLSVFAAHVRILFWYTLMTVVFRFAGKPLIPSILLPALRETALYIWQLALVLLTGTLFYETTSTLEIRHTLTGVQRAFERAVKRIFKNKGTLPDIGFLLSLTITFIPRIFDAWTSLNRAWDARGGNLHAGLRASWRKFSVLIPSLFIKLLAMASDTDRAIRNRSAP